MRKEEFKLLLEAFFFILYYKLYLYFVPFKRWSQNLNRTNTGTKVNEQQLDQLKALKKAVQRVGRRIHFKNQCLVLCLASFKMLKRRGFKPEFHLGVDKNDGEHFMAHAWLHVGNFIFISDEQTKVKLF